MRSAVKKEILDLLPCDLGPPLHQLLADKDNQIPAASWLGWRTTLGWFWVCCISPMPAEKGGWGADQDVSETWILLAPPSVFPRSNWVGLMSWQDFLSPAAISHAVIPQQGFDGVQMALLFPFPSPSRRGWPALLSKQGCLKGPLKVAAVAKAGSP